MTHISISTMWSERFTNIAEFIQDARGTGFTHLELNSILSPERLKELLSVNDLGISSVHAPSPNTETAAGMANRLSLGSLNENERRAAIEVTVSTINLASEVGARVVVVHAGYADMNPDMEKDLRRMYLDGLGESDEFERLRCSIVELRSFNACPHVDAAKESLRELADYARKKGIQIALENRVNYHEIPSIDEMVDIMSEFQPEVVGYWHDVGHAEIQSRTGFTPHMDWFKALEDRMVGVHLHDLRGLKDHYAPGSGDINWRLLADKLAGNIVRVCEIAAWNEPEDAGGAISFLKETGVLSHS
ncbi:MAG: sugar phosphate isomerase/epimerase family protein [Dehalococcoidia bacterium]